MKSKLRINFINIYQSKHTIWILITIGTLTKALYSFTRNIFPSGPDANGFIPTAERFHNFGFFGGQVDLPNIYSAGYPFFLSFFVYFSESDWYKFAQVGQICLFGITTILIVRSLIKMNYRNGATLFAAVMSFHPGWLVATSMAMYETLLYFLFGMFLHVVVLRIQRPTIIGNWKFGFIVGFLLGLVTLVHPRGLIIFIPFLLFVKVEWKSTITSLVAMSVSLIPWLIVIMYRTYLDLGTFNLGGDAWTATWIKRDNLQLCRDFGCYFNSWLEQPNENITHALTNLWYFLSPYSGPAARGTWFHNLSLQYFLYKQGFLEISLIISYVLFMFGLAIFTVSLYRLLTSKLKRNLSLVKPAVISIILIGITDMLVYGDNRHRLIALPIGFILVVLANFQPAESRVLTIKTNSHHEDPENHM